VVDQSDNQKTLDAILKFHTSKVRYFTSSIGKSKALNLGLQHARGTIIAFTDDDCVVTKHWVRAIMTAAQRFRHIDGFFGSTLPYKPRKNMICPATISLPVRREESNPYHLHYKTLGLGNNMAIRKKVFSTIGTFTEWLGPGAHPKLAGGEDSELIYRMLKNKYILSHEPEMVVYHNRWLSSQDEEKLQLAYTTSLLAYMCHCVIHKRDIPMIQVSLNRACDRLFPKYGRVYEHLFHMHLRGVIWENMSILSEWKALIHGAWIGLNHV
jgi:glycosyltransferase involved in cell wall biosynthesis